MNYNRIIILLIALIVVILVVGGIFLTGSSKQDAKLEMISNSTIHTGSIFLVKLSDLNNNSISNASINVVFYDNDNNVALNQTINTNDKGDASLEMVNISEGNYSVNITFGGNNNFKPCSLVKNIELKDIYADVISTDSVNSDVDTGAFYSKQSEKMIYTGDIQLAPDGHHYKHMGNNEWVKID